MIFRLAFRSHLRIHRLLRSRLHDRLRSSVLFVDGNAGASDLGNRFVTWRASPKCGHMRIVSEWTTADGACFSAAMLSRRVRREKQIADVRSGKCIRVETKP